MRKLKMFALVVLGLALASCNQNRNTPEEIRKQAADAAAQVRKESETTAKDLKKEARELSQDAQAAAQGAKEGWNRDDPNRSRSAAKKDHRRAQE